MNNVEYNQLSGKFQVLCATSETMKIHSSRRATVGGHSALIIADEMNKLLELLEIDDADENGVLDNEGREAIISGSFSAIVAREVERYKDTMTTGNQHTDASEGGGVMHRPGRN